MDTPFSQNPMEGVWGQLYPHCGTFPRFDLFFIKLEEWFSIGIFLRLPLRTDAFRLGRAKSCDYVIR